MRSVSDGNGVRTYTILFNPRPDIHVEMLDELLLPSRRLPPFEILNCDMAGYILSGGLVLEIKNEPKRTLLPGDAIYISQRSNATAMPPATNPSDWLPYPIPPITKNLSQKY